MKFGHDISSVKKTFSSIHIDIDFVVNFKLFVIWSFIFVAVNVRFGLGPSEP